RRDREIPLSFAQQRLWFLEQLEPGAGLYHVPATLRLIGALDLDALTHAFDQIVRRHEVLRTTFEAIDGRPIQIVHPPTPLSIPVTDLQPFDEATREARAVRIAEDEARQPFDLRQGPLLRTRVLRLGENDHVLLVTRHHIVSDGWSTG